MSDLISRSALLKSFKERCQGNCKRCDHSTFLASDEHCSLIDEAPTVEARPVVRGEWIHDINNLYGCSVCMNRETMSPKKKKNFCPECGADMRGVKNELC